MNQQEWEEAQMLRRLYWYSFVVRLALGITGWLMMQLTSIELLQDAIFYEEVGASIANDWLSGRASSWLATQGSDPHRPVFIVLVVAAVYTITLGVRVLPLVLAIYSAITAHAPGLTYKIAKECGASPRAARFSGWLVALSPAFVFWSGCLYKEGLILVFLNLSVYHLLRLQSNWDGRAMTVVAASLVALGGLRLYLAMLVSAAFCVGLIFGRSRRNEFGRTVPVFLRQIVVLLLFTGIIAALTQLRDVQRLVPDNFQDGLDVIQSSRNDLALANSGYLPGASFATPGEALRFAPLGMAYFLAVPLPWQTGSIRQNMAIPDTALWLLLYPLVLAGMVRGLRRNPQACLVLILTSLAMVAFYALLVGNIGTAYRMRVQVWLLWAVFAGIGWELMPRRVFQAVTRKSQAGTIDVSNPPQERRADGRSTSRQRAVLHQGKTVECRE
jgi:hypothetical protein